MWQWGAGYTNSITLEKMGQTSHCSAKIYPGSEKSSQLACGAELDQYPLLLNIQKWALYFWNHVKTLCFSTKPYAARSWTHKGVPSAYLSWGLVKCQHLRALHYNHPSFRTHALKKLDQHNYDERKRKIQRLLDRTNKILEQNGNIHSPKQTVHCGNLLQCQTTVSDIKLKRTLSTDCMSTT